MNDALNQKEEIIDKVIVCFKSDPDDPHIQSRNKHHVKYIKDKVINILDYSGNTTECPPDGTIVIRPHYLENLPNEILGIILSYLCNIRRSKQSLQKDLYQCSLVSKQFYLQTNPLLWHSPIISNTNILNRFVACLTKTQIIQQLTNPSDSLAMGMNKSRHHPVPFNILTAKHHVRELDIESHCGWDDIQFSLIMPSLELLETLTIVDSMKSKITDASLQYLPRYCPYLIKLEFVPTTTFTKRFIGSILQNCDQLHQVQLLLTHNNQHPDVFKSLLQCRSLSTLILKKNYEEVGGNESFLSENMVKDMMALYGLKILVFFGREMAPTLQRVMTIIQHGRNKTNPPWPLLTHLHIDRGSTNLGDPVMIPFIESHPHLTYIHIFGSHFSNSTLHKIGTHLPGLTYLTLGRNQIITKDGLYLLVRQCHDLKQVNILNCKRLLHSMGEFPKLKHYKAYGLTIADMDKIRHGFGNT